MNLRIHPVFTDHCPSHARATTDGCSPFSCRQPPVAFRSPRLPDSPREGSYRCCLGAAGGAYPYPPKPCVPATAPSGGPSGPWLRSSPNAPPGFLRAGQSGAGSRRPEGPVSPAAGGARGGFAPSLSNLCVKGTLGAPLARLAWGAPPVKSSIAGWNALGRCPLCGTSS